MDGRIANIATNCLIAYVLIRALSSPHEVQTLARSACSGPTRSQNAEGKETGEGRLEAYYYQFGEVRTM